MIALLKQKEWSPYLAGALLGVVYIVSIALAGIVPGASGAFENVGGLIAQVVSPALAHNTYFKFVMPPGISWEVILMAGVLVGAFVSANSPAISNSPQCRTRSGARCLATRSGSVGRSPSSAASSWSTALVSPVVARVVSRSAAACSSRPRRSSSWRVCSEPAFLLPSSCTGGDSK